MSSSEENWTQYSEELYLLRDMFLSLHLEHHVSEEKYQRILNGYKIGLLSRNRKWEGFDYVRTMNVVEFIEKNLPEVHFRNSAWQVCYNCPRPRFLMGQLAHINFIGGNA